MILDFDQVEPLEHFIKKEVMKYKNLLDRLELREPVIGDVVAVLNTNWQKWVRGEIKFKDENGLFYVWAVDYGVPMISNPRHVMKMTPEFSKFSHVKRIYLGGIINCVPSELKYDFEKNAKIMHKKSSWSSESLEIAQKFISTAVELKFDVVSETSVMKKKHEFGHLKARMLDGTLIYLANRLSTASVAEIITDDWYWKIFRLDTIHQETWKTINGVPLAVQQVVLPISSGQVQKYTNDERKMVTGIFASVDKTHKRPNIFANEGSSDQTNTKRICNTNLNIGWLRDINQSNLLFGGRTNFSNLKFAETSVRAIHTPVEKLDISSDGAKKDETENVSADKKANGNGAIDKTDKKDEKTKEAEKSPAGENHSDKTESNGVSSKPEK